MILISTRLSLRLSHQKGASISKFKPRKMSSSTYPSFGTKVIHKGQEPENWDCRQVVPPISLATTYKQPRVAEPVKYDYGRAGNPTRDALETCLAGSENGKHGYVFASGLAATTGVATLLKSGDHIVCCDDVYGGTGRYFRLVAVNNGLETDFVDLTLIDAVEKAIKPNTKLLWMETPTNPLLKICDIEALVKMAKKKNPNILTVVDNTFMSPYFQRPLDLGADMVVHSITKYINGHTDVVMGCIICNDKELAKHLRFVQLAVGMNPSPFDCYLVNRGLKTLHVRMKCHQENGLKVAEFLEQHPLVEKVLYPALPSHPQHEIWKKQCKGMSGMLSFYMKGGVEESKKFLMHLKIFILAESLGGFESLAEHPALMTHASVPADHRKALGIGDNLVRLSVGLEDIEDLIQDLDQALKAASNTVIVAYLWSFFVLNS